MGIKLLLRARAAWAMILLCGFPTPLMGQETTFHACYVPNVGAVYMIKIAGTPDACLSSAHVEISWTDRSVTDGSIGTLQLADSAVTTDKLRGLAVTTAKLANGSVTTEKLDTESVRALTLGPIIDVAEAVSVPGGGSATAFAACPEGTRIISGGYVASATGDLRVVNSVVASNGWFFAVLNEATVSRSFQARAYCLDQ